MTSPSAVLTSSATMTKGSPSASSRARKAPSISLWSAMAMAPRPISRAVARIDSTDVTQSLEKLECICRSALIQSGRSGPSAGMPQAPSAVRLLADAAHVQGVAGDRGLARHALPPAGGRDGLPVDRLQPLGDGGHGVSRGVRCRRAGAAPSAAAATAARAKRRRDGRAAASRTRWARRPRPEVRPPTTSPATQSSRAPAAGRDRPPGSRRPPPRRP